MNKYLTILTGVLLGFGVHVFAIPPSCPDGQTLVAYGNGLNNYDLVYQGGSCQPPITTVNGTPVICFPSSCSGTVAFTLKKGSSQTCEQTQVELTVNGNAVQYDISLVNGFDSPASITVEGRTITAESKAAKGPEIYPFAYDWCNCAKNPPSTCEVAPNCPPNQTRPGNGCNIGGMLPVRVNQ